MDSHKLLREICKKIGYECTFDTGIYYNDKQVLKNVREIVFTQEFMDYFWDYYKEKQRDHFDIRNGIYNFIIANLDNPVKYLHNLLFKN